MNQSPRFLKARFRAFFMVVAFTISPFVGARDVAQDAVAAAHPAAVQVGLGVLAEGGNAFDAAVAVAAMLAVVEPFGSGLGGGGFFLLHEVKSGRDLMLDGRETAPKAASPDMYMQAGDERASLDGALAAGIPGLPAALAYLQSEFGSRPLSALLKPAIAQARTGTSVSERYQEVAAFRAESMAESAAEIFLRSGEVPALGALIQQPELAETLDALAKKGRAGFYAGPVAERLVRGVRDAGGRWSMEDLAAYQVRIRTPVTFSFYDARVVSAALPSSGGIVLAQTLGMLERLDVRSMTAKARSHLVVEAMRRAYHDRAVYLADSDRVDVPVERLLSPAYLDALASTIDPDRATSSTAFPGRPAQGGEGRNTTHFSIIDRAGNRVAATLSLNYPFGAGVVVPGTGILLNNEMDDFVTVLPDELPIEAVANRIEAGKRMLSSMSPTFVEWPDGVAVLGTPGGKRIISMVLLAILDMLDHRDPTHWVGEPRYHHQYLPDELQYEEGQLDDAWVEYWLAKGHVLKPIGRRYGDMQALWWSRDDGSVQGASDPRGEGAFRRRER